MCGVERVQGAEWRIPERAGALSPRLDVCVGRWVIVVTGSEHRVRFWQDLLDCVPACVVTAVGPLRRGGDQAVGDSA